MKQEKLKKVGEFNHARSGIVVSLYLRHTHFVATVLEEEVSAPEAKVLESLINDRLEHWMNFEWFPVIKIDVDEPGGYNDHDDDYECVKLTATRFYLSRSPVGEVVEVAWDVDEIHRKAKFNRWSNNRGQRDMKLTKLPLSAPFPLGDDNSYLIDYTEPIWQNIEAMKAAIKKIRTELQALIRTRAGVKRIAEASTKLLA